ncbi:hypothetical protein COEREDRAFT_87229 [Coemansia reversa NRRL 1564]|uniref:BLOC-1-related complex subunit 5 n=1 Tax=Coemansia reversa (strain ATCC 12441 / NRRL 1564) TaxID=763665 RepID=A0A2G5BB78_COERN|nr:hypothetical protein COEREDRAFT_87229 [Coemansia reversa NRRL 1564]|eukprot:PIA16268.1 hypothetical protein COEREDRAFT_87229 [Coemansia reversa NRRL 1564]
MVGSGQTVHAGYCCASPIIIHFLFPATLDCSAIATVTEIVCNWAVFYASAGGDVIWQLHVNAYSSTYTLRLLLISSKLSAMADPVVLLIFVWGCPLLQDIQQPSHGGANGRRAGASSASAASNNIPRGNHGALGNIRWEGVNTPKSGNSRRIQQIPGTSSQGHMRSMDFSPQRNNHPATPRSRLSHGITSSSFKEPRQVNTQNSPYMHSPGPTYANDSRISLLSMAGTREEALDVTSTARPAESSRLSLGPSIKNIKSSRTLSNQHSSRSSETGRPRSRTQSSEQGVVTVFSGAQPPPPLDADLDALNRLPIYRPLVLAPSGNRLSGLFHLGVRYIEPTAEQLNLDETELTGFCFSFRDYMFNRVQHVCNRQSEVVAAAKHVGSRALETHASLACVGQLVKHEQGSMSVLKTLQRQAEKSYELIQDILHDLERLEASLPEYDRLIGNEHEMAVEFPCLSRMLAQRRRSVLPAVSPDSNADFRRQIVAKSIAMPAFPPRTSSVITGNSRSGSQINPTEPGATSTTNSRLRPGPYRLPGLVRQSSAMVPTRNSSKRYSEPRSLRPRGSRGSVAGSERSGKSVPASPNTADEARVSFDGESINPQEATSIAVVASSSTQRHSSRRSAQPFGTVRPPNSSKSIYGDYKGGYSRSEVSLSKEQVLWSPQISSAANESTFGYFQYGDAQSPAPIVDADDEYLQEAKYLRADRNDHNISDDNGDIDRTVQLCPGPLAVPSNQVSSANSSIGKGEHGHPNALKYRRPRLSVSVVQNEAAAGVEKSGVASERSPTSVIEHAGGQTSNDIALYPAILSGLARIPQLRGSLNRSSGSPKSPKSLPHTLSLCSASSIGSSPSTPSTKPTTPLGSPAPQTTTRQLNAVVTSDVLQINKPPLSPNFPLEATRILKQMVASQSDGCESPDARSMSRSSTPQGVALVDHYQSALPVNANTHTVLDHNVNVLPKGDLAEECPRSRTSSFAMSQLSATEGSDASEPAQSGGTVRTVVESRTDGDSIRGSNSWARNSLERMSTWSASSTRTLADGMYGSRVSSTDDPFCTSKRPPSSAALNTLAASAAMFSRKTRGGCFSSSNHRGSTIHGTGVRVAGARPAIDLGLSIRSDLVHRVRSYSESGRNHLMQNEGRPHSSMGFHETISGAPIWSVRPDSIHLRRNSPHSASLRHFRTEKFNPHRRSMMSTGSQLSKQGSLSSDILPVAAAVGDCLQSDSASVSTSYSSQPPDRALPLQADEAVATNDITMPHTSVPGASSTAGNGKRRAQTMDNESSSSAM